MKLFQQMLVAGAAVSMLAPLGAQATDINLEEMNSYGSSSKSDRFQNNFSTVQPGDWAFQSIVELAEARGCNLSIPNQAISRYEAAALLNACMSDVAEVTTTERKLIDEFSEELATIKGRVDGLEAQFNNYEAGGFSDTTTLDGKAIFTLAGAEHSGTSTTSGAYDATKKEGLYTAYSYTMNLNTSFTGDDNLYVRLKAGNASGWAATTDEGGYLVSSKGSSDAVGVDKIWYSFPVGERNTVWIGPKIENYYMHATTPSLYSPTLKQFTLGGNASAYGASTNAGVGWAYNADNGFAISSNVVSKSNGAAGGWLTNEVAHSWATQVGYTQPQYSISAIVNMKYNGWTDSYFSTSNGKNRSSNSADGNSTNVGLRAWWRPADTGSATPSISVGYDTSDISGATAGNDSTDMWFVGLNWADIAQADDLIGLAFGQAQTNENDTVDPFSWEAYYQYKVNDGMSVRTTVFGNTDRNGTSGDDNTGVVLETTFAF